MMVVISYDINTADKAGRRRLRRVSKACLDFGQRVQFSVFECDVSPDQWVLLRAKLTDLIDEERDSLRFYFLGSNWRRRVEHLGTKQPQDLGEDLIMV